METNKPVAWITPFENVWTSCVACGQRVTGDFIHTCSPQLKQLTDEEITAIWQTDECYQNAQAFARAILRKATNE